MSSKTYIECFFKDDLVEKPLSADANNFFNQYLQIWRMELEHTRTNWIALNFFFGVSFSIFGFSFTKLNGHESNSTLIFGAHLLSIIVFWFAYVLLARFCVFNEFTRELLKAIEKHVIPIKYQTLLSKFLDSDKDYYKDVKKFSKVKMKFVTLKKTEVRKMIFRLGICYTLAIIAVHIVRFQYFITQGCP